MPANKNDLLELVDRFRGLSVLVYGDFVLDEFLYGRIDRISREAPVFIVTHERSDFLPGCGANAVANLAALGAAVFPCGLVGADDAGDRLLQILDGLGASTDSLVRSAGLRTAVKTRVIAGSAHSIKQQIVRIDKLAGSVGGEEQSTLVRRRLEVLLPRCGAVLISDYHIGGLDARLAAWLNKTAGKLGLPVLVDSRHRLLMFRGATAATPNQPEVEECLGVRIDGIDELHHAGRRLLAVMESDALVITRGGEGMTLFRTDKEPVDIPAFGEGEVIDVSGAGDTVIAAFTLGVAAAGGFENAALLSNIAGGLSVFKKGTSTVGATELRGAVERA